MLYLFRGDGLLAVHVIWLLNEPVWSLRSGGWSPGALKDNKLSCPGLALTTFPIRFKITMCHVHLLLEQCPKTSENLPEIIEVPSLSRWASMKFHENDFPVFTIWYEILKDWLYYLNMERNHYCKMHQTMMLTKRYTNYLCIKWDFVCWRLLFVGTV